METFVLRNADNTLFVELIGDVVSGADLCTISEVRGRSAQEEAFGILHERTVISVAELKDFADDKNLILEQFGSTKTTHKTTTALAITTSSLAGGNEGVAYSEPVGAEGGNGTKTYSISEGDLPAGLAIDSATGEISGTPTTQGTSTFTVKVADEFTSVELELSITIAA